MHSFVRPRPRSHGREGERLITRDFLLLFFLVLCANCYLAIYYCLEQWLEHVAVPPTWRGVLLGSLFGMVFVTRPGATVLLLKASKLPPLLISLLVSSAALFVYQFLPTGSPWFEWMVLGLRVLQGFALAIFSSCSTSLLVGCIPPGQSARGFALFSLTTLIPYGIIPTLGEFLLPIVGDEPALFAWTSSLVLPCLLVLFLMRSRLRVPEVPVNLEEDFVSFRRKLLHSVTHSGLGLAFTAILCFGLCTNTGIYFMKGLCGATGGDPTRFFFYYTSTIMVVRLLFSHRLDRLPRYRVVPVTGLTMALGLGTVAWGPSWAYIPGTILYGASLSLLYPLQAAAVYDRSTSETRGINSNLMVSMFDMAALLAPMVGGGILHAGLDYHWVITAGALSAALSGLVFAADGLRQRARAAKETQRQ